MKEVSRDFAHKTSPWRKAIAVITATALVASMSNIQAFGASEGEEPPAVDQTVTVRFEVDEGVMVRVAGQPISADDPMITATTAYDLSFSVEPTVSDTASYTVGAVEYTFGNVKEEVVSPVDPIMPDEDEAATPGEVSGEEPDASPSEPSGEVVDASIPDPTVVPDEDSTPDVVDDATAGDIDNAIEPSEEVTLSDDLTPMADSLESSDAEETPAVSDNGVIEADEGVYRLAKETLAAAAEQNKEVVVRVSSELAEEKVTASDWDALKEYLELPGKDHFISIKLENSIEALETVEIVGKKNIELNGKTIAAAEGLKDSHLFVVKDGSRLTLTDAASKSVAPQSQRIEKTTSSDKYADKDIAKLGTYNADTQELIYYVSTSDPDRATGTSQEERVEMKLDMSTTGAVLGKNLTSLVKVENGVFDMSGGRLTNTGGNHGIEASGKSRVQITGGFIVGNGPGNEGAGIKFDGNDKDSSSLTVGGSAVVGGNTVAQAEKANNGGGIWVNNCTLTIEGNSVVAANYAGGKDQEVSGSNPVDLKKIEGYASGEHYGKYNGGGVYVQLNSTVILGGNAVIAGNRAASDGGGVYVKPSPKMIEGKTITSPTNTLIVKGHASISNNKAMRNMAGWNPKNDPATPDTAWFGIYTGGGGGIFSMGTTTIKSGQVVNNFASDGGGGILLPGEGGSKEVVPDIFADFVVVAGNYCDGSEGGGIYCQPKAVTNETTKEVTGDSYIKTGYITNNATATAFDYGGGGLFLVSGGFLRVYSPLVTANTAQGWGGGVAACTNGTVITSDAAIFDNTAHQEGYTTNNNEYGDRWAANRQYWYNEVFGDKNGNALPDHASDDYFCAKQSEVYDNMLGGGYYNWKGYMSGKVTTTLQYEGYKKTCELNYYQSGTGKKETIKLGSANVEENREVWDVSKYLYMYVPSDTDLEILKKELIGSYIHLAGAGFKTSDQPNSIRKAEDGVITEMKISDAKDLPGYTKVLWLIDTKSSLVLANTHGGTLYDAEGNPTSGAEFFKTLQATLKDSKKAYNIYKINQFPAGGRAEATRFMALKAYPTTDPAADPEGTKTGVTAKQDAFAAATVFFTGNYSANNGGGIGCNGKMVIGRDPKNPDPEDPKLPDDKYFNLTINKSWSNLGDLKENQNGTLTAAFKVTVYKSKDHYEASTNGDTSIVPVFETVLAMTFDKDSAAEQERVLENLKEGWYVVVEEIGGKGDNFEIDSSTAQAVMDANMTMKFKNTYKDEDSYSTGVVNSYATDTDEDGNSIVSVTQDSLYLKRTTKVETNTPEEPEPSTEGTPVEAAN